MNDSRLMRAMETIPAASQDTGEELRSGLVQRAHSRVSQATLQGSMGLEGWGAVRAAWRGREVHGQAMTPVRLLLAPWRQWLNG